MGITKVNSLKVGQARAKQVANLPTAPYSYYGSASNDVDSVEWRGGEMCYLTTDNRFYIQTATSGTTATWKRLLEQTVSV